MKQSYPPIQNRRHTTRSATLAAMAITAAIAPAPIAAAPAAALADPTSDHAGTATPEITLDIDVGEPMMLAGSRQTAYIKISLTGFDLPAATERPPVNLALVLDRSSSMSGDKFEKAKVAAGMVLDRLGRDDILSIITYDSTVEILVPATVVGDHREAIRDHITALTPRGSTALFGGVSQGIAQLSAFLDSRRVNRVILLSDGQANIGPSSPNELGRLGESAGKRGISISTVGLGLGYNEDLMTQLAMRSDGNHGFAETADELATIFRHELGDVLSVVAQDVAIEIEFAPGIQPVGSLNRDIEIHGNNARMSLNQLYSNQEKYFLIEVQVPAGAVGTRRTLATVAVNYDNMLSGKTTRHAGRVDVGFAEFRADVVKSENRAVMVAAIEALAVRRNREAVALRDQGQIEQAEKVLLQNSAELKKQGRRYRSKRLEQYGDNNLDDARHLQGGAWNRQRKAMRKTQHQLDTNQAF